MTSGGTGGPSGALAQALPLLGATTPYTFSFWFLPSLNGTGVSFRVTSAFHNQSPIDYRPILLTPGTANTVASILPPFPPLWLNEVQAENLVSIVYKHGEPGA